MVQTHVLIGEVALAVEAATDCKDVAEFKTWVADKIEAGAQFNFGDKTIDEAYAIAIATVKPVAGKTANGTKSNG